MSSNSQTSRHHRKVHLQDTTTPPKKECVAPTNTETTTKVIPKDIFSRKESQQYFEKEVDGNGASFLVAQSVFGPNDDRPIHETDTTMMLTLGKYVGTITRLQRDDLCPVLDAVVKSVESRHPPAHQKEDNSQADLKWRIDVPTTPQQIRKYFLEGKSCVFQNLPHPEVLEFADHAVVLPSECIKHLFAHGHFRKKPQKENSVLGLASSKAAKRCLATRPAHIPLENCCFLSFWSDDFEPNYAKLNRGSVWIKTMSVHIHSQHGIPITHVFPLVTGGKGVDHDPPDRKILEDLQQLALGIDVYDGAKQQVTKTWCKLVAVLQDQPERRSCNRLMLGNSNFHGRFGWSFDFGQTQSMMRPCENCFQKMLNSLATGEDFAPDPCTRCTNFAFDANDEKLWYRAPKDFPFEETRGGYLPMVELSYEILKQATQKAHDKIVSGQWSMVQASEYLRVHCLNTDAISGIKQCAKNCAVLAGAEGNPELEQAINEERESDPTLFQPWRTPAAWESGIDIVQSCEIGMHLLFKGVTSTFTSLLQDWFKEQRKYEDFLRHIQGKMDGLKGLHLDWLKAEPYTRGELGGWVSENYGAFARVSQWAYSALHVIKPEEPYAPPEKDQKTWTKIENSKWLSVRKLDTKGSALELRERVAALMREGAPPIPPPIGGSPESVEELVISFSWMMSGAMTLGSDGARLLGVLVRVFLTRMFDFDKNMNPGGLKPPCWVSSYNFLCLLNLPKQLEFLGPIRNRWEGGPMGEGLLRIVKPALNSPNRKNWHVNLVNDLLKERSIMLMEEDTKKGKGETRNVWGHLDHYKVYSSFEAAISDFIKHEPLSCIAAESDEGVRFFFAFKFKSGRHYAELPLGTEGYQKLGMMYFELTKPVERLLLIPAIPTAVAVLLPMLDFQVAMTTDDEAPSRLYAVIDSNWRQLGSNAQFTMPYSILPNVVAV